MSPTFCSLNDAWYPVGLTRIITDDDARIFRCGKRASRQSRCSCIADANGFRECPFRCIGHFVILQQRPIAIRQDRATVLRGWPACPPNTTL